MHIMTVCYFSGQSQEFIYDDAEQAKACFQLMQTAITQYQRWKNDNSESLTLVSNVGESVFRVEHLVSVSLSDIKTCETVQFEYAEWQGRMIGARDASRASALSRPQRGDGS